MMIVNLRCRDDALCTLKENEKPNKFSVEMDENITFLVAELWEIEIKLTPCNEMKLQ